MIWLAPLIALVVSLIILFKSSEELISSVSVIAKFLRISELAIGFFLLSLATSLPELLISIESALAGNVGLAIGNVFGSNVADITLVLGVAALFSRIAVSKHELKELVLLLLATSLVTLFLLTFNAGHVTGFFLIALFLYYSYVILRHPSAEIAVVSEGERSFKKSVLFFIVSLLFVFISSNFAVDNAILLSQSAGLSAAFIGATLMALGTSLPEVAVTLSAIRKRRASLAAGNVVGSCVVNLTLVLGSALLLGGEVVVADFLDLAIFSLIANNVLVYFLLYRERLGREEAIILLAGYFAFLLALTFNQFF